jgi:dTDP-4-amino-4,6-dideoxygalactose transaminase
MTDLQCALALSQFGKLEKFITHRRELVRRYDARFSLLKNCRPAQTTGRDSSGHHLYVLRIDFASIGMSRAQLMQELRSMEIGSQVHYIPVPTHPYFRTIDSNPADYPNAQNYYQEALSLPVFFDLSYKQQDMVITAITELVG